MAQDYIGDELLESSPSTGHEGVASSMEVPTASDQMESKDYDEEEFDRYVDELAEDRRLEDSIEEVTRTSGRVRNSFID